MALITTEGRTAFLAGHPIFAKLSRDQRSSIAAAMGEHRFHAGEVIFQSGDPADRMYVITSGSVRISQDEEGGREVLLNIMRRNDIFGEIALIDDKPRSASATAHEDCLFLSLSRPTFTELIRDPQLAAAIFAVLVDRLRYMTQLHYNLTLRPVQAQVPFVLGLLADKHGHKVGNGIEIRPKISQKQIGDLIGTSRGAVNEEIQKLKDKGLVSIDGRKITVRDRAGLDAIVHATPIRRTQVL